MLLAAEKELIKSCSPEHLPRGVAWLVAWIEFAL